MIDDNGMRDVVNTIIFYINNNKNKTHIIFKQFEIRKSFGLGHCVALFINV